MASLGFVSSPGRLRLFSGSRLLTNQKTCRRSSNVAGFVMQEKSKKGLFGRLKDSVLKTLVTVPGGGTANSELIECVFCTGSGICNCDACKGTGKDALGTCLMCDGKTHLTCTVCCGVGTVDRIRRGGTDDRKEFVVKKTKG